MLVKWAFYDTKLVLTGVIIKRRSGRPSVERDVELLDRYDKIVGKKGMIDFVLTQFGTQSKLTVETGV